MKKAVITADIVQSSKIPLEQREWILVEIQEKLQSLSQYSSEIQSEIFRGDSFQCQLNPRLGLRTAILLKTYIKSLEIDQNSNLKNLVDVRISIAVGNVAYASPKLSLSDGEAFHLSGRRLDELKKQKMTFAIGTDDTFNDELAIEGILLDLILSKTTSSQCQVLHKKLQGLTETKIANELKIKQSAVNQRSIASGWHAIDALLKRFETIYKDA